MAPQFFESPGPAGQGLRVLRVTAEKPVQQWQCVRGTAGFQQCASVRQIRLNGWIKFPRLVAIRKGRLPILMLAVGIGALQIEPRILRFRGDLLREFRDPLMEGSMGKARATGQKPRDKAKHDTRQEVEFDVQRP